MKTAHTIGALSIRLLSAIAILCLLGLAVLTALVIAAHHAPGDWLILTIAMAVRTTFMTHAISVLTFIGSAVPTMIICAVLSLVELRHAMQEPAFRQATTSRQRLLPVVQSAWPLLAFGGAVGFDILMRIAIGRLPPEVERIEQLLPEVQMSFQRYSFPSGHACTVLVTYGALSVIAWRTPVVKWVTLVFAIFTIAGVGFGRLYLGVHWPSDVLAGYFLGTFWLMLALMVRRYLDSVKTAQYDGLRVESK